MSSLTLAQRSTAAQAYRAVRRTQKRLCKGDSTAERAVVKPTQNYFLSFLRPPATSEASTSTSAPRRRTKAPPSFEDGIKGAWQIKEYMEANVVQGVKNEKGNYELHFTEKTKMGYNDENTQKRMDPPLLGKQEATTCCSA
ncbi:hypothetical protein BT69DRAFT_1316458 [Atractiella rhizophila]|nr:hypothetical protein BT69DRAFT_1316458 [Atractiella rhizophila]